MVFYLKINRNELYTFRNLQHWIRIIECMPDSRGYILCDNNELKEAVLNKVEFPKDAVAFMESCKDSSETEYIVSNITNALWRNAGYAHISTFSHAKENRYPYFWNIDADDTCICLSPKRACEMLSKVEMYAREEKVNIFSLDMWPTRTKGYHWSFGVSFVDNTVDWFGIMKEHCQDAAFKAGQIENVDGYFTCLKNRTALNIETFYAENLKFVHYSDDFLKRPDASGFFHWRDGKLILPILKYCFGIDSIGTLGIADGVIGIDMGITDKETTDFLLDYAISEETERLKIRMGVEQGAGDRGR